MINACNNIFYIHCIISKNIFTLITLNTINYTCIHSKITSQSLIHVLGWSIQDKQIVLGLYKLVDPLIARGTVWEEI